VIETSALQLRCSV